MDSEASEVKADRASSSVTAVMMSSWLMSSIVSSITKTGRCCSGDDQAVHEVNRLHLRGDRVLPRLAAALLIVLKHEDLRPHDTAERVNEADKLFTRE